MTELTHPICAGKSRTERSLRFVRVAAVVAVAVGFGASCSNPDKPKKRKPVKLRDPVEQKVFYDGWWPERW